MTLRRSDPYTVADAMHERATASAHWPPPLPLVWRILIVGWILALAVFALAVLDVPLNLAMGEESPYQDLRLVNNEAPAEWIAFALKVTHENPLYRPATKNGQNVYILLIEDKESSIAIPWPEGMSATEALMAWKRSP